MISERAMVSRRFMPPDRSTTLALAFSLELDEVEQLVGALARLGAGDARSRRRRPAGCRGCSARGRGCPPAGTPRAGTGSAARGGRVQAEDRQLAAVTGETAATIRIVEDLPAPLGPRNPNDSPGVTSRSMPLDRLERRRSDLRSPRAQIIEDARSSPGSLPPSVGTGARAPGRSSWSREESGRHPSTLRNTADSPHPVIAATQAPPPRQDGRHERAAEHGPVVLVTGVGRTVGLGAAIALRLAEDGWDVATTHWSAVRRPDAVGPRTRRPADGGGRAGRAGRAAPR